MASAAHEIGIRADPSTGRGSIRPIAASQRRRPRPVVERQSQADRVRATPARRLPSNRSHDRNADRYASWATSSASCGSPRTSTRRRIERRVVRSDRRLERLGVAVPGGGARLSRRRRHVRRGHGIGAPKQSPTPVPPTRWSATMITLPSACNEPGITQPCSGGVSWWTVRRRTLAAIGCDGRPGLDLPVDVGEPVVGRNASASGGVMHSMCAPASGWPGFWIPGRPSARLATTTAPAAVVADDRQHEDGRQRDRRPRTDPADGAPAGQAGSGRPARAPRAQRVGSRGRLSSWSIVGHLRSSAASDIRRSTCTTPRRAGSMHDPVAWRIVSAAVWHDRRTRRPDGDQRARRTTRRPIDAGRRRSARALVLRDPARPGRSGAARRVRDVGPPRFVAERRVQRGPHRGHDRGDLPLPREPGHRRPAVHRARTRTPSPSRRSGPRSGSSSRTTSTSASMPPTATRRPRPSRTRSSSTTAAAATTSPTASW